MRYELADYERRTAVWSRNIDALAVAHDAAVQMINTSIVRMQHGALHPKEPASIGRKITRRFDEQISCGDGGDLYKFVTTRQSLARYLIDGGAGVVSTAIGPFHAYDGTRYATIDASPERPVTVTVRGDGTFTISRP